VAASTVENNSSQASMVQRMTAIMDTFDSRLRRRSLQDVSMLSGLPRSTAHRILEQLVELGWVDRTAAGYGLGWRAHHFSGRVSEEALLREAAAPFVHELAVCTNLVVHLAVLDGPFVRYLDKVGGPAAASVPSRVGGFLPAHLTAVGKAMLAFVEPEALDVVLDSYDLHGRLERIDLPAMYRELSAIRMKGGLNIEHNGAFAAVACVGAPIFGSDGRVAGGLSLCDCSNGNSLQRFGPLLLARAKRVSARLADSRGTVRPLLTSGVQRVAAS
jgi:DNA-binding IclR family transcriptional regulator